MNLKPETERRIRRQKILDLIKASIATNGFAPTEREVAKMAEMSLTRTHEVMDELVKIGCIRKQARSSRTLVVIKETVE